MTTRPELLSAFGTACDNGNAAVFVGAGLSRDAGLPSWERLLEAPRSEMSLPATLEDYPLLAEYLATDPQYGRQKLMAHLLSKLRTTDATPIPEAYTRIARLPIDQIWTTNYDSLIERALTGQRPTVIATDDEIRQIGSSRRSVIKMHGSIDDIADVPRWAEEPVITRSDYERYEMIRPRTWALLRATYMSRTFLFLGFSFTDPNIEVLQRLARLSDTASRDRHFAVMRRPDNSKPDEQRLYDLRARDLEASGVRVHTIDDYGDIDLILEALVRRTRPPRLFISGSMPGDKDTPDHYDSCCAAIANELFEHAEWEMASLGGDAGWRTSKALARMQQATESYDARQFMLHFRRKAGARPPVQIDERIGTAVFTDLEREPLVNGLLDESRAVLVIGGGERTAEEIGWALGYGAGVVPLAVSGGSAYNYWQRHRDDPPQLGGRAADPKMWALLASQDQNVAARAAHALLEQAMYSDPGTGASP